MEPDFNSPHWALCEDRTCPLRFVYERSDGGFDPHYHFTGSDHHPAWDVP